jgi:hypothetical protein
MAKSERDVTAEFVELMCALDTLCDRLDPDQLAPLDLRSRVRIGRVVVAHREFRQLCEDFDSSLRRSYLAPGRPPLDS